MVGAFLKKFASYFPHNLWRIGECRACRRAAAREDRGRVQAIFSCSAVPFGCERCRMAKHSPGQVANTELLHFLVTEPRVIDPRSGRLLPVAVNQMHEKGLSVLRDRASNDEFNITFLIMKKTSDAKGEERFWHSVSTVSVRSVRYDGEQRFLAVFDTAYPDRPAHADIMAPPVTKRERKQQDKMLLDRFNDNLIAVKEFRGGAFIQYVRPQ